MKLIPARHLRASTKRSSGITLALMKPRVMQLVVFTALVGMLAGAELCQSGCCFASILFVAIGGQGPLVR